MSKDLYEEHKFCGPLRFQAATSRPPLCWSASWPRTEFEHLCECQPCHLDGMSVAKFWWYMIIAYRFVRSNPSVCMFKVRQGWNIFRTKLQVLLHEGAQILNPILTQFGCTNSVASFHRAKEFSPTIGELRWSCTWLSLFIQNPWQW